MKIKGYKKVLINENNIQNISKKQINLQKIENLFIGIKVYFIHVIICKNIYSIYFT